MRSSSSSRCRTPSTPGATNDRCTCTLPSVHVPRLEVRWLTRLVALVLLGLAVHLLLPQIANFSNTWQTVQNPVGVVALAVVLPLAHARSGVCSGLVRSRRSSDRSGMEIPLAMEGSAVAGASSLERTYGWIHRITTRTGRRPRASQAVPQRPVLVIGVFASIPLLPRDRHDEMSIASSCSSSCISEHSLGAPHPERFHPVSARRYSGGRPSTHSSVEPTRRSTTFAKRCQQAP